MWSEDESFFILLIILNIAFNMFMQLLGFFNEM
jgi:hypothetical protein